MGPLWCELTNYRENITHNIKVPCYNELGPLLCELTNYRKNIVLNIKYNPFNYEFLPKKSMKNMGGKMEMHLPIINWAHYSESLQIIERA